MKKEIYLKKLGRRIAGLRKEKGFSQDRLYLEAEMSRGTIHKIETGRVDPRVSTLLKISNVLKISMKEIFNTTP